MSKSECEAVAFYQTCFSVYYPYKQPYEWDVKTRLIIKVNRSWDLFIHRLRIPPLLSLICILASIYVLQYKNRFPNQSELTFLGEILLYMVSVACFLHILLYKLIFIECPEDLFPGINRLMHFNRSIRSFNTQFYKILLFKQSPNDYSYSKTFYRDRITN
jgi:hypothetical protein